MAGSRTITYDPNGNRTGLSLNGSLSAYTVEATSNRVTDITNPAGSFEFESAANTTQMSVNREEQMMSSNFMKIPGSDEWGPDSGDLDVEYARQIFFGKSAQQMTPLFARNVLERVDEIRFMPDAAFPYYMLALRDYVLLDSTKATEMAPDAASSFIGLVAEKLAQHRALIQPLMGELLPALEYLVRHQTEYGAEVDIYGDFAERVADIKRLQQG